MTDPFAGPVYTYRLVLVRCSACSGRIMGVLCVDQDPAEGTLESVLASAYWDTTHLRAGTCDHHTELPSAGSMRSWVAQAMREGVRPFEDAPAKRRI